MEQNNQPSTKDQKQATEPTAAAAPALGLSTAEVEARQQQHGLNEITEKQPHAILKFLWFFWGPIAVMIEAAAVIAAVIHRWDDFYIILAMLLLKAGVGFWQ
jgi:H+-transporting ATPase